MTTPTTPFEDKVRDAMQKFTEDIDPSPDALDKIKHASFLHVHRRAITGASLAFAAAIVATFATVAAVHSAPSNHVAVTPETQPTVVTPTTTPEFPMPTGATTPTTIAVATGPAQRSPRTTTTTVRKPVDACPQNCIARAAADVDGDGRADQIGMMYTQKPDAHANFKADVRVVFADGRTVDYSDSGTLLAGLQGVSDVNGDGRAEIFVVDYAGAHSNGGKILRWNGTTLAPVTDSAGKTFVTDIDSEATNYHDAGFECQGNQFITYDGGLDHKYTLTATTYAWNGNVLTQVSQKTTTYPGTDPFNPPPIFHQIAGAHCPGLH